MLMRALGAYSISETFRMMQKRKFNTVLCVMERWYNQIMFYKLSESDAGILRASTNMAIIQNPLK